MSSLQVATICSLSWPQTFWVRCWCWCCPFKKKKSWGLAALAWLHWKPATKFSLVRNIIRTEGFCHSDCEITHWSATLHCPPEWHFDRSCHMKSMLSCYKCSCHRTSCLYCRIDQAEEHGFLCSICSHKARQINTQRDELKLTAHLNGSPRSHGGSYWGENAWKLPSNTATCASTPLFNNAATAPHHLNLQIPHLASKDRCPTGACLLVDCTPYKNTYVCHAAAVTKLWHCIMPASSACVEVCHCWFAQILIMSSTWAIQASLGHPLPKLQWSVSMMQTALSSHIVHEHTLHWCALTYVWKPIVHEHCFWSTEKSYICKLPATSWCWPFTWCRDRHLCSNSLLPRVRLKAYSL